MSDIKLFLRNLWRSKLYSFITVVGFAMALMFVIVLTVYIRQELSVDQFHTNKDRIYRAVRENNSSFGPLIGEELKNKYPEIETYTRLYNRSDYVETEQGEKIAFEGLMVDSSFFRMFSYRLLEGDPSRLFRVKNEVVLSKSFALKVFGETAVVGKEINMSGLRLPVVGVLEDMPQYTHLGNCDVFLRFDYLADLWGYPQLLENNDNSSFALYVMAAPNTDLKSKESAIVEDFKQNYWLYKREYSKVFQFEPLTEVYWSDKESPNRKSNNKNFVLILAAIAVVILILALINYNNLSMAQLGFRAKEAAIKKLVGITNAALFRQFVLESVLLCYLAFGLAVVFAFLLTPLFNQVLDTQLHLPEHISWIVVVVVLLAVGILGFISGFVPAWMIIRFRPVEVVKGVFRRKVRGNYGKVLICFQYAIAIALMISSLVIYAQTKYLENYDLGFDKENVVYLSNHISPSQKTALRNELGRIPGVLGVSFTCGDFFGMANNNSFTYKGKNVSFTEFKVDTAFFRLMNIKVHMLSDAREGMYVNKTGVTELELNDTMPQFAYGGLPMIGITEDFHFRSLEEKVGPALMIPLKEGEWPWGILVKVSDRQPLETFRHIREVYNKFVEGEPFDITFADERINKWYEGSERMARLIGYFSFVAIVLAMMGILAMATFYISQRVKEIGLRRVNGATILQVLTLLLLSFVKWIGLAFVIATPVTWYAMTRWLQDFPFHLSLTPVPFLIVGCFVTLLALFMVGYQSYRAATVNPVNSLKNE